jgi:hypothetical protein
MAITVRFPNGQAVKYNFVNYVDHDEFGSTLKVTKDDSNIIARILKGSGAIVEFCTPCEVSNPITDPTAAIDLLMKNLRSVDAWKLRSLKRELQKFNAQTYTWKEG